MVFYKILANFARTSAVSRGNPYGHRRKKWRPIPTHGNPSKSRGFTRFPTRLPYSSEASPTDCGGNGGNPTLAPQTPASIIVLLFHFPLESPRISYGNPHEHLSETEIPLRDHRYHSPSARSSIFLRILNPGIPTRIRGYPGEPWLRRDLTLKYKENS